MCRSLGSLGEGQLQYLRNLLITYTFRVQAIYSLSGFKLKVEIIIFPQTLTMDECFKSFLYCALCLLRSARACTR